jgi:hypothetical protein
MFLKTGCYKPCAVGAAAPGPRLGRLLPSSPPTGRGNCAPGAAAPAHVQPCSRTARGVVGMANGPTMGERSCGEQANQRLASQHQQYALAFASGKHQSRHAVRRTQSQHQQYALAFASGKHQPRHAVRRRSRSTGGTRCSAPAGFLLAPGGSSRRMSLSLGAESCVYFSLISM